MTAAKRKVKKEQKAWKYLRNLYGQDGSELNKLAIIDGDIQYTYAQVFREWERYAAVFTALDMTEEQSARVGVLGSPYPEVFFASYGLNMVGAQVSLIASWASFSVGKLEESIRQEKLTDFIITDEIAQPDLVNELLRKRKELGLRHVILLHVHFGGDSVSSAITAAQELKYASMKQFYNPICMDTLLMCFGNGPVRYAQQETEDTAFILHTTGTTSGAGKPVPMSDMAINEAAGRFLMIKNLSLPFDNLVSMVIVDISTSYGFIDQVHLPFVMGATVVIVPLGILNPLIYKVISSNHISFMFSVSSMFDRWIKMPEEVDFDFSSLKFVALGGTSVSAADKKRYSEFLEEHGGKDVMILNGYGLTEMGGACCLSSPDLDDESIGYPMPGFTIQLYDEDNDRFFTPGKEGGDGILYLNSPSMSTPVLDGNVVVDVKDIDGKPYVCTKDHVRVDPDGRITYLGRATRFFLNEEGRKYDSGRVETEFSRLKDIENCAIVPVSHKMHHDTVPMLCVKTVESARAPQDVILEALRQVFVEEKLLSEEYIPSQVMLVEKFPLNSNGKIDLFQLNHGKVSGDMYTVEPVRSQDQVSDFRLIPCEAGQTDVIAQILEDMSEDIKKSMPGQKRGKKDKSQTAAKETSSRLYEDFDLRRYLYQQWMNNRRGMQRQMVSWPVPFAPLYRAPKMHRMNEWISDMGAVISEMKNLQPVMKNLLPSPQSMMEKMSAASQRPLPTPQSMIEKMVTGEQGLLPWIDEQSVRTMFDMNKIAFEINQWLIEHRMQMDDKVYKMLMMILGRQPEAEKRQPD